MVMLFHAAAWAASPVYFGERGLSHLFGFGHAGVPFFFALSGFIIVHVHAGDLGHPERLGAFLRRRFARIFPAYWVVFLLMYAALLWGRHEPPLDTATLARSLLLMPQDWRAVGGMGAPVLIVTWSLQYEMLFYAVFALALCLPRTTAVFAAVLLALPLFYGGDWFPLTFLAAEYPWLFAFGAAVALLLRRGLKVRFPLTVAALGTAAFFGMALVEMSLPGRVMPAFGNIVYGGASAVVILGLINAEVRGTVIGAQTSLQRLGDASYLLYLTHFPVISLVFKLVKASGLTDWVGALVAFVAASISAALLAVLAHERLERPLLRWLAGARARA